ncbi:MAG: cytochrome b/b6 domain-containing protein [Roseovarius sp.]|nr:cytochrome b/b6 domain-containing protein [Roseovarius sp.]
MAPNNSPTAYGSVAKLFHWLTALLILVNLPLGWIAAEIAKEAQASGTDTLIARATLLFSVHKTTGVAIFFVALARILWALSQPRPGLLNGDRPLEALAAATVHWLLYGALVLVPLSGWVHHAATTGFAPIWWPFGQDLPFVPKSARLAELAGVLHVLAAYTLAGALTAHVAGALKHHLIDRDETLRRMLPGTTAARPTARQPGHRAPLAAAVAIWGAVLVGAAGLGWFQPETRAGARGEGLAAVSSDWVVGEGSLQIRIRQMGSEVTGGFADWTAAITYAETPDATGRHGTVEVVVAIPSLSLGAVTAQAMGREFFDAGTYPTATFRADLVAVEGGHVAHGTLTIKGASVPVDMPFTLALDGDSARAEGRLTVDRRDFGIGMGVLDADALGFEVDVSFALEARRAAG